MMAQHELQYKDIELLHILRAMCDVTGELHESKEFDSQTVETSNSQCYRTDKSQQIKRLKVAMYDYRVNMSDHVSSSAGIAAEKRVDKVLTNKIYNEFSDVFLRHRLF